MKTIAESIAGKFVKSPLFNLEDISAVREGSSELNRLVRKICAVRDYPDDGCKPYFIAQNMLSIFIEELCELRIARRYRDGLETFENRYMPDGPPYSPLSRSYAAYWQAFDFRPDQQMETIGSIFYALAERSKLDPLILRAVEALNASRMGLYEVIEAKGLFVTLRELLTGQLFRAICISGHLGRASELFFTRMVPNLSDPERPQLIMLSPYVILGWKLSHWISFFERQGIHVTAQDFAAKLYHFFKYGPADDFWHEYIMNGYVNYNTNAILLTGIPDVPESLPHWVE